MSVGDSPRCFAAGCSELRPDGRLWCVKHDPFAQAALRVAKRLREVLAPTQETTMSTPNPLTLEQLVHDLRESIDDRATANAQTSAQHDVVSGAVRALDDARDQLDLATQNPVQADSQARIARIAYAQGVVAGVALCLRGLYGLLPDES